MSSTEIRNADTATLKMIFAGMVREASDRMSRGIAHDEMEDRGVFKRRF